MHNFEFSALEIFTIVSMVKFASPLRIFDI